MQEHQLTQTAPTTSFVGISQAFWQGLEKTGRVWKTQTLSRCQLCSLVQFCCVQLYPNSQHRSETEFRWNRTQKKPQKSHIPNTVWLYRNYVSFRQSCCTSTLQIFTLLNLFQLGLYCFATSLYIRTTLQNSHQCWEASAWIQLSIQLHIGASKEGSTSPRLLNQRQLYNAFLFQATLLMKQTCNYPSK